MALKPEKVFELLETAYRKGALDKLMPLVGESIDGLKQETGMNMEELINKLDGAKEESIIKMNRFLGLSGPLFGLAANDFIMGFLARLLDLEVVKKITVWGLGKYFERAVAKTEGAVEPLANKVASRFPSL